MRLKTLYHIVFFLCGWLFSYAGMAQQGFYVPKAGSIFFNGDSATIFSNVLNEGRLGVGKKAVLNFKGGVWVNDQQAAITDESNNGTGVEGTGGVVRFLGDNGRQQLVGGYNAVTRTGAQFSSLQVENPFGLELQNGSAKVLTEMILTNGLVHLNGNTFVVGNNNPGTITGYDAERFFVTGASANGSMLLRENIRMSDGRVVFPLGIQSGAYTPAAIQSHTTQGDHYYASVFDGVRSNLFNGNNLVNESVNKTWQVGKTQRPNEDEVSVYLQHLVNDEGSFFAQSRHQAYVSQFLPAGWDKALSQATPSPGTLTTGSSLLSGGLNERLLTATLSNASYFTKFAGPGDTTLKTKLLLGAFRVNSSIVKVNWQTRPEVNVREFIVERRFANENSFIPVDTVSTLSAGTINLSTLNYGMDDGNSYRGISFYRLKVVQRDNTTYYSNTVAVRGVAFYKVLLWPNPTPNKFNLIINSPSARAVVIFNNIGQKVWSTPVTAYAQTYMEIKDHHLIPGTYFVSIIDDRGKILETEKLLIVER